MTKLIFYYIALATELKIDEVNGAKGLLAVLLFDFKQVQHVKCILPIKINLLSKPPKTILQSPQQASLKYWG